MERKASGNEWRESRQYVREGGRGKNENKLITKKSE